MIIGRGRGSIRVRARVSARVRVRARSSRVDQPMLMVENMILVNNKRVEFDF